MGKENKVQELGYKINLENVMNFVFNVPREVNTEITESYEGGDIGAKVVRESKNDFNTSISTIKYDLFKTLLSILVEAGGENGEVTFGELTVINTLLDYKLIEEK